MEDDTDQVKKPESRATQVRITENNMFAELTEMLPIAQNAKQDKMTTLRLLVAYLQCRWAIEKAEREHQQILATVIKNSPTHEVDTPTYHPAQPTIMMDNAGNILAGSLADETAPCSSDPYGDMLVESISDLDVTTLGIAQEKDPEAQRQYLERYKGSLVEGMREFLGKTPLNLGGLELSSGGNSGETKILRPDSISEVDLDPAMEDVDTITGGEEHKERRHGFGEGDDGQQQHEATNKQIVQRNAHLMFKATELPVLEDEGWLMLEAARGFLLMLDRNLTIIFVSENVSQYLGYSQAQIIGKDISDFTRNSDVAELQKYMNMNKFPTDMDGIIDPGEMKRSFFIDMKYCFQKKTSKYKSKGTWLFHWNSRLTLCCDRTSGQIEVEGLVSLCQYVETDSIREVSTDGGAIHCKLGLDRSFIYIDPRLEMILGYTQEEATRIDPYMLKHPNDTFVVQQYNKKLLAHGKSDSGYYRMIRKNGNVVWMFTRMEVVKNRVNKPSYISINCFIVSPKEAENFLCRDEEEYKRFKCEGFGRAFQTNQELLSSMAANDGTSPLDGEEVGHPPEYNPMLTESPLITEVTTTTPDVVTVGAAVDTSAPASESKQKAPKRYKRARLSLDSQNEGIAETGQPTDQPDTMMAGRGGGMLPARTLSTSSQSSAVEGSADCVENDILAFFRSGYRHDVDRLSSSTTAAVLESTERSPSSAHLSAIEDSFSAGGSEGGVGSPFFDAFTAGSSVRSGSGSNVAPGGMNSIVQLAESCDGISEDRTMEHEAAKNKDIYDKEKSEKNVQSAQQVSEDPSSFLSNLDGPASTDLESLYNPGSLDFLSAFEIEEFRPFGDVEKFITSSVHSSNDNASGIASSANETNTLHTLNGMKTSSAEGDSDQLRGTSTFVPQLSVEEVEQILSSFGTPLEEAKMPPEEVAVTSPLTHRQEPDCATPSLSYPSSSTTFVSTRPRLEGAPGNEDSSRTETPLRHAADSHKAASSCFKYPAPKPHVRRSGCLRCQRPYKPKEQSVLAQLLEEDNDDPTPFATPSPHTLSLSPPPHVCLFQKPVLPPKPPFLTARRNCSARPGFNGASRQAAPTYLRSAPSRPVGTMNQTNISGALDPPGPVGSSGHAAAQLSSLHQAMPTRLAPPSETVSATLPTTPTSATLCATSPIQSMQTEGSSPVQQIRTSVHSTPPQTSHSPTGPIGALSVSQQGYRVTPLGLVAPAIPPKRFLGSPIRSPSLPCASSGQYSLGAAHQECQAPMSYDVNMLINVKNTLDIDENFDTGEDYFLL